MAVSFFLDIRDILKIGNHYFINRMNDMKKKILMILCLIVCICFCGCEKERTNAQIAATTQPVYEFTTRLCKGTDISVTMLITENVSCLHNYTLHPQQMRKIENAQLLIISGAGLEDFLEKALLQAPQIIDASQNISLICPETEHNHDHSQEHSHENDPHIWLSPANAAKMAENICAGLIEAYPVHTEIFMQNLGSLLDDFQKLSEYAENALQELSTNRLITFHDGFSYMAQVFKLDIIHAIEEESGSETSAAELKEIINLVKQNHLPAIFTETNGSVSAAEIISRETNVPIYQLDMVMGERTYFEAMYHNINTLKEALG